MKTGTEAGAGIYVCSNAGNGVGVDAGNPNAGARPGASTRPYVNVGPGGGGGGGDNSEATATATTTPPSSNNFPPRKSSLAWREHFEGSRRQLLIPTITVQAASPAARSAALPRLRKYVALMSASKRIE
ncbi:hypothetical protein MGN70_013508 [Eutypa lata]|nr:hypothetical protein MGN70_013508 [Eutypa lata]